jgi:LuxR family transcriptional regulator, quorum-sensing system regulator CciR
LCGVSLDFEVQEFLTHIKEISSLGALESAFLALVRKLGFASAAYYRLYGGGRTHSKVFLFGERQPEWQEIYSKRGFAGCDPRNALAFRSTAAFTWDEAMEAAPSAAAAEVVKEARRVAAIDGFVTPVRSGVDELGICVLYSPTKLSPTSYERLLLQGMCGAFSRHGLKLLMGDAEDRPPVLTAREAECLQLVAAGYSDQEIATALCRSFNTVHTHVESLRSKLRARSRAQLILRATMAGLLPVGGVAPSTPVPAPA